MMISHSKRTSAMRLPLRVIVFLNSYAWGLSGGDVRFIEIAKRINSSQMLVITSQLGKNMCEKCGLKAKYLVTTYEPMVKNVILIYILRILKALNLRLNLHKNEILYSTSDFLPDVLPAFINKCKNRDIRWVALMNLIAPNPFLHFERQIGVRKRVLIILNSFLYRASQSVSIFFMKYFADTILVPNKEIKEYLIKRGLRAQKVAVVNQGVNSDIVQEASPLDSGRYDACFVGRFHPQKGLFDVIRIWEIVCTQKKDAKLAIVGKGSKDFEVKVRSEIIKRGLKSNIDVLGFLSENDKFGVLKSSKVFLFPSHYESWGIVVAEAMASRLPVVAYNLPVFNQVFPKGMLFIPCFDIKKFAEEVVKLLTDEDLRKRIAYEGSNLVKKYDWNVIAKREIMILRGQGNFK